MFSCVANTKFADDSRHVKPIGLILSTNLVLVATTFATIALKYASSFTDSVPMIMDGLFIVYELYEYFTSFKAFMRIGLLIAYPIRKPAMDLDFENVLTTTRLSYLSMSSSADFPPKSI